MRTSIPMHLDHLEERRLLSGAWLTEEGNLVIKGASDDVNQIEVSLSAVSDTSTSVTVKITTGPELTATETNHSFDAGSVKKVLVFGGKLDDTVTINALTTEEGITQFTIPTRIQGRAGNDNITAGDGADIIHGGEGDDLINGGGANDKVFGGRGLDTINGGAGNDFLSGGGGGDSIEGEGGNDRLWGQKGINTLNGGEGDDRIFAHKYDTYEGGEGEDWIKVSGAKKR